AVSKRERQRDNRGEPEGAPGAERHHGQSTSVGIRKDAGKPDVGLAQQLEDAVAFAVGDDGSLAANAQIAAQRRVLLRVEADNDREALGLPQPVAVVLDGGQRARWLVATRAGSEADAANLTLEH